MSRTEVPKVKKTVYLTSKQDGLKLHVLLMEPEGEPKGIVQIVHGMAEHKERYEPFMEMLCKHGYISVIHDHRGHGKSIRKEEDLGYFYDEAEPLSLKMSIRSLNGQKNDTENFHIIYLDTAWDHW